MTAYGVLVVRHQVVYVDMSGILAMLFEVSIQTMSSQSGITSTPVRRKKIQLASQRRVLSDGTIRSLYNS